MAGNAWTLAQAALNEKDPLKMGILMTFWLESNAMACGPWITVPRINVSMTYQDRLSLSNTPLWAAIGDTYGTSLPQLVTKEEQSFLLGKDIDVPRQLIGLEGQFEDPRVLAVETSMKEFAYWFNDAFINGPNVNADGTANPNAPTGIRQRIVDLDSLAGLGNVQTFVGGNAGNGTAFGPTASSANRQAVLDALNLSIYTVDTKRPDWGFLNQTLLLAIESAFRREGLFTQYRDQYERIVYTYREIPLYDIGLKADQVTQIITDTETQGNVSTATSVYFGKNGVRTHFHFWEKASLDTRDLGEVQTGAPRMRTRVDWEPAMANWHQRALTRVGGILATT